MDIFSILDKESCKILDHKVKTKQEMLWQLADMASKSSRCKGIPEDVIFKGLEERESNGSTGFGNEIAIPHCRVPGLKEMILLIAVVPKAVEFDAIDKKKVKLFFVILAPEDQVNEHLQVLAMISRVLSQSNVKEELLLSRTAETAAEIFLRNTGETAPEQSKEKKKMKLLYVVLYMDDFLYHILEYFIEQGIEGATIIDSSGMGEYISNIPLFATFIGFMNTNKNMSKTLMALIPEEREQDIVKGIEDITGNLDTKQGAMLMTVDVSMYKGTMKMM